MKKYLSSEMGRLRLVGFLEGWSLIILVFAGMPMKYLMEDPTLVRVLGPIHGILFILFVVYTLMVASQRKWSFWPIPFLLLASSFVPFGTFIMDRRYLRKMDQ